MSCLILSSSLVIKRANRSNRTAGYGFGYVADNSSDIPMEQTNRSKRNDVNLSSSLSGSIIALNQSATRNCRQYAAQYLSYVSISAPQNPTMPFCSNGMKMFSNEHEDRQIENTPQYMPHPDKKNKSQDNYENFRKKVESATNGH
ncbi:hypothetical protein M513_09429 [Trichuris suis]|uniref:Uncharacterized protein n=1 Tax=Trichuris suis TaxID=68888 RepID=A0A085LXN6_9BILA|nr:hypothetical protein M513_09429 [Trichuris suis]